MKNDILSNPTHVAKIGYNGMDLEQNVHFSASSGMLLPVWYDFLYPGDKLTANARVSLRTQPMETAAQFSADVRLDWFAVPVKQLFRFFGSMYYNINDIGTDMASMSNQLTHEVYPNITFYDGFQMELINQSYSNIPYDSTLKDWLYNQVSSYVQPLNDRLRLLDCFHWPVAEFFRSGVDSGDTTSFALMWLMAYQKIYFDYYRISDREDNDPRYYNYDSFFNGQTSTQVKTAFRLMSNLRYIPHKKDVRTNVFVSPLQGSQDVGSLGLTQQLMNNWLSNSKLSSSYPVESSGVLFDAEQTLNPTSVRVSPILNNTTTNASKIDVNRTLSLLNASSIRSLFAVEKALDITRRAGKHYDAQTLAHWGVDTASRFDDEVIYLGSQKQPFIVGDVVSTSSSGDEPLGTIAGKGYSSASDNRSSNNPVKFSADGEMYIVMCLFSVQPDVIYTQRGADRLTTLVSPKDFVHPELDNLGMQPYYWYQFYYNANHIAQNNVIYGWQYAYSESKIKENRVFGALHNDGALYSWVPQFDSLTFNSNGISAFLVSPQYFNNIWVYPFHYQDIREPYTTEGGDDAYRFSSVSYSKLYEFDPFIVDADFAVNKVSKMSKYSLPQL